MDAWMIVEEGPKTGGIYRLTKKLMTVGRSPENHIQIVDKSVSRQHSQVKVENDQYLIMDLMSRNGTWVNGVRVTEPTVLFNGDIVKIGNVEMLFLMGRAPENQTDLVESWRKASKTTQLDPTTYIKINKDDIEGTDEYPKIKGS